MRLGFIFLLVIFTVSCEKRLATKVDPEFIGEWVHHSAESFHEITIYSDGRGYNLGGPNWPLMTGDQQRKWFIRGTTLEFGHATPEEEKFHIDTFPQTSIIADTIGNNYIFVGDKYMWLDGRVYRTKH